MSENPHRDHLEPGGVDNRLVLLVSAGSIVFLSISIGMLAWIFYSVVPERPRRHD